MNTNPQREREVYQIVPFKFENQPIGIMLIGDQPWFIAHDIGEILGIKAIKIGLQYNFSEEEIRAFPIKTYSRTRPLNFFSINGLNRLLFVIKNRVDAELLNCWLLSEAIPDITRMIDEIKGENVTRENDMLRGLLSKKQDDRMAPKYTKITEEEQNLIIKFREAEGLSFEKIGIILGRNREQIRKVYNGGTQS